MNEKIKALISEGKIVLDTKQDQEQTITVISGSSRNKRTKKVPLPTRNFVDDGLYTKWITKVELILKENGYVDCIVEPLPSDTNSSIAERQMNKLSALSELLQSSQKSKSDIDEIISLIEKIKDIMVSVSTGGYRIQDINPEYQENYDSLEQKLHALQIKSPNPYSDLWEWYGRWSSGDLPTYKSRRQFISEMFSPLLKELKLRKTGNKPNIIQELTGWPRVDRTVGEIRKQLADAQNEEQYQAIGLLCREAIISLAQSVYNPKVHPNQDEKKPSNTDAKRMLEDYIAAELAGSSNEAPRKHAKAAFELANDLQHKRTADFRRTALCVEATVSIINVIAIISGIRDPE